MRRKLAMTNVTTRIIFQVVTMLSGFVVQRLLIGCFGSPLVGLTASITKFLGFITLLEAGMGRVVVAALYKPLADKDNEKIGSIHKSSNSFFRKIALVLLVYIVVLGLVLPRVTDVFGLGKGYTFLLTVIIGLSSIMQYYFGITNQLLLEADQRQYIPNLLSTLCAFLNAIVVIVLVRANADIIYVKLLSSIVLIIKPAFLYIYCRKKYKISTNNFSNEDVLEQKWAGLGHHIAYFVHTSTDVTLLTIMGQYSNVSVYTLYTMITGSLTSIIDCVSSGIQAAFGNIIAKNEVSVLNRSFDVFETIIHLMVTVVFGTAGLMIIPFISIYTRGIADVEYVLPLFGCFVVLQEGMFCLRRPYITIIEAAGHYKQTQRYAYAEAITNIIISVILVKPYGLVGIVLGTFIAMTLRIICSVLYLRKNILNRPLLEFIKCIVADVVAVAIVTVIYASFLSQYADSNYFIWAGIATLTVMMLLVFTCCTHLLFHKNSMKGVFQEVVNTIKVLKR